MEKEKLLKIDFTCSVGIMPSGKVETGHDFLGHTGISLLLDLVSILPWDLAGGATMYIDFLEGKLKW